MWVWFWYWVAASGIGPPVVWYIPVVVVVVEAVVAGIGKSTAWCPCLCYNRWSRRVTETIQNPTNKITQTPTTIHSVASVVLTMPMLPCTHVVISCALVASNYSNPRAHFAISGWEWASCVGAPDCQAEVMTSMCANSSKFYVVLSRCGLAVNNVLYRVSE